MKTLFVTGGAGFIGSEFIRQAIQRYRIVNFDKLTYAASPEALTASRSGASCERRSSGMGTRCALY